MKNLDFYHDFMGQPFLFGEHRSLILAIPQQVRDVLSEIPVLTGIATSLSAWRGAYALFCMQTRKPPVLINTCDLLDYCYPQALDTRPLFVMSRSGDSAEIVRLMETVSENRTVIGITEGETSALAGRSDLTLLYHAQERAFPNTASFTLSQIYALAVMAGAGCQMSASMEELLQMLEEESEKFCRTAEVDETYGRLLAGAKAVLVEGQGFLTGVAEQYALDFQETRTAGIPVFGGIMRHGVIELTENEDVVTVLLIPDDSAAARKFGLAKELCDGKKKVIVVTDAAVPGDCEAHVLRIPSVPLELKSIFFTLGMQKLYGSYIDQKENIRMQPALVGKVTRRE